MAKTIYDLWIENGCKKSNWSKKAKIRKRFRWFFTIRFYTILYFLTFKDWIIKIFTI